MTVKRRRTDVNTSDDKPAKQSKPRIRVRLKRQRVALDWYPEWTKEYILWTKKYIYRHKWRVDPVNDVEDLLSDAYLIFQTIVEKYPRVTEPRNFMALYKVSVANYITDKSREFTRRRDVIHPSAYADQYTVEDYFHEKPDIDLSCENNMGEVLGLIKGEAPELQLLLDFLSDENNLKTLRDFKVKEKGKPGMTINQKISSLLGIDFFPFRETLRAVLNNHDV